MRKKVPSWAAGALLLYAAWATADEPTLGYLPTAGPLDPGLSRVQAPPPVPPAPTLPLPAPPRPPAPPTGGTLPPRPTTPAPSAMPAPAPGPAPVAPATGAPFGTGIAGAADFSGQPPAINPGMFGGPPQGATGLAGLAQTGIPQMIGDAGPYLSLHAAATLPQPFPPPPPPRPPSPRKTPSLNPSVRGLKISENQSPRPQDRVFFTFDYFSNVNGPLNQRLGAPVRDIRVYRYIFGWEQTFDNGNGSIGVQLPLDQLTSDPTTRARFKQFGGTSTGLDDMDIFLKYIVRQDPKSGSLFSVGMAVAPTTGGSNFAGAKYIQYVNTTLFQPFVGYIWNPGKFYLQGFSAFEFPVNSSQATMMYNDIGMGYFLKRTDDPTVFLTAVAPTFEVHVNSPLNQRGFDNPNDPNAIAASVNLTYGLNLEFGHNSLLTLGIVTPVTGPQPFSFETLVLFNYRFGRSARRAVPPVISG